MGFEPVRTAELNERLLEKMSVLSPNAKAIFSLLLLNVDRNSHAWEFTKTDKSFPISYLDYIKFGISRKNYNTGITELEKKQFIRVSGKQRSQKCMILEW